MNKTIITSAWTLLILLILGGCASGTKTVDLAVPSLGPSETNGHCITVTHVTDARIFETRAAKPSMPSIDGDVAEFSKSDQSRMIGRERNRYGNAIGEVTLPQNATVEQKVKQLVEQGLSARGYEITHSERDFVVGVQVEEFWAWFTPDKFDVIFEARIRCAVTIEGRGRTELLEVLGTGSHSASHADNADWNLVFHRAFSDFMSAFTKELEERGF